MSDPTKAEASPEPGEKPDESRRRVLKGGLAAAPVLMTVASRPVLGNSGSCATPSGFVSGNASVAGAGVVCEGRTLGYWKTHLGWPAPYHPDTQFNAVFAHNAQLYPNKTLLDVLKLQGGAPYNDLARTIVAALLNAQQGWTPVLSPNAVKAIWSEYLSTGSFSPTAGVHWDHDDIMVYLATTQPQ